MKIYERTENGVTRIISVKDALAEANHAMMGGRHEVRSMSSSHGRHWITYRDGRDVRLEMKDIQPLPFRTLVTALDGVHGVGKVAHSQATDTTFVYEIEFDDGHAEFLPAEDVSPYVKPVETDSRGRRIVTAKGKRYIVGPIIPARPKTEASPTWIPEAYANYWTERNGETFGSTRNTCASDKPGSVGRAVWDAVND